MSENNFQSSKQATALQADAHPALDRFGKGLASDVAHCAVEAVAARGWEILREDVSLPVAVLREARITHNLQWMQSFIDRYQVKLAPHGKTTMSPALFQRQLAHGAWGITLATAPQTRAAFGHGVRRVLLANQLVGRANMAIIAALQQADPAFEFCCCVDSVENVEALGAYFTANGQRLRVLLEYGVPGGRTGVRDVAQEEAVRQAIRRWPALSLIGVELYEGVLNEEGPIRDFLRQVCARIQAIAAAGDFAAGDATFQHDGAPMAPILSGAGSAWYDVVAEEFTAGAAGLELVLRPGCYLTHDVGVYRRANERIQAHNPIAREMQRSLLPALQLWAYVQSVPEAGKAIVALGKRDAAFDAGFPEVSLHYRPSSQANAADAAGEHPPVAAPADWKITAMMDQHAFLAVPPGADIRPGDMLCFDISHPCLTFDKWKQLLLVDEGYKVTGAVTTFF